MPNTGLPIGPLPLRPEFVQLHARKFAGAYALSREDHPDTFIVNYVGRSDDDLLGRLLTHVRVGKYTHFKCGHAENAHKAFEWECRMFHDFGETRLLDNEIHPDRPAGVSALLYLKCPSCVVFG